MKPLDLLDRMRRAPALRRLPLGALERLASASRTQRFAPGEPLVREGEPGDAVYLLLEGRVAVRMDVSEDEQRVVATRAEGDWIGEMALLESAPRAASVTSEGETRALCIPREAFLEAVTGNALAALDLLRTVSGRLRQSDAELIDLLRHKTERLTRSNRLLARENRRLRGELDERAGFEAFVGSGREAGRVRAAARRAAESELPVLLRGETGTGKELVARALHAASERRERPFVAVNCALFTEALLESELFGHVRGAFTGASTDRRGLVEAAHGGTLVLDELAAMPPPIPAALLRFLELGEFRRLGETGLRRADVRLVAATSAELEPALASGRLRRDLFYRLDVFRIELPPLRERPEDVPELAATLSAQVADRLGAEPLALAPDALEALAAYDFPGNVRELRNEIERLYATHGGGARVGADALSAKVRRADPARAETYGEALRTFKARLLGEALEAAGGNRARAAARLGLHRSNLVRMIRDLGLEEAARGGRRGPEGAA